MAGIASRFGQSGDKRIRMKTLLRGLEWTAMALIIAAIVLWLGDWAVFAVRSARGNGYDTVQVQQFLSTALKGNKEEYDYMGTTQVTCARALFPRAGAPPCWWQRRHPQQWQ
jgi:hypothetical protein